MWINSCHILVERLSVASNCTGSKICNSYKDLRVPHLLQPHLRALPPNTHNFVCSSITCSPHPQGLCIAMSLSWNLLPRLSAWLVVSLHLCPNSDIIFREILSDINAGCSSNFCFTLFSSFIVLNTILNYILCFIIVNLLPLSYKLHEGRDLLCLTITFPVLAWRLVCRPHSANMSKMDERIRTSHWRWSVKG